MFSDWEPEIVKRPTGLGRCPLSSGKSGFLQTTRLLTSGALAIALWVSAVPLQAQSPAILLGDPQIQPGLPLEGFAIATSVSQTATATNITYNVIPPSGGFVNPGGKISVGSINLESVLPPGTLSTGVTTTVTFTGVLDVDSSGSGFPLVNLGLQAQTPSPQSTTGVMQAGTSRLVFSMGASTTSASTMTVSINLGSPTGARKPYLNDFSGVGATSYTVWRPSEGNWYIHFSNASGFQDAQWGLPGDVPVAGDYDGDGITDYAVWRPSEGNWFVLLSGSGRAILTQWGGPGDFPITGGDFDGDGKTDHAVWRPSDGTWYVISSSTGEVAVQQWGGIGDIPLAGDYDGDGKADYAVWRPSEGNWYVISSRTGAELAPTQWGGTGDVPVPADYDGDGKTDYAVWRPADGTWYIILSSTGQVVSQQWGGMGDTPVPGDYDGDGKADYAVWRPSEGNWYVLSSKTGELISLQWGGEGDIPIGRTLVSAPSVP